MSAGGLIPTVGHSTRGLAEFLALLSAHGVEVLAGIRTAPRSRHNPQFNRDSLPHALAGAGMEYLHLEALGGLGRPRPDSRNGGWEASGALPTTCRRGSSTRRLVPSSAWRGGAVPGGLMCAEAVPWRCHRSLVADAESPPAHFVRAGARRAGRLSAGTGRAVPSLIARAG